MWQKVTKQNYHIDYVNIPLNSARHYGHPGRLTIENGNITYGPEASQLTFIKWFALFFIPLFSITAYLFIPDTTKWIFVIAGPTIGTLTFGTIYFLIKQEIDAGPYIRFESDSKQIVLPRFEKRFDVEKVKLQWITGRLKHGADMEIDLNLIVEEKDEKYRYFVMGGPYRKYVKQFVELAEIDVVEVNLGWNGFRDADRNSIDI